MHTLIFGIFCPYSVNVACYAQLFGKNLPQIMMNINILQKAGDSSDSYERDIKLRVGKIIFVKIENIEFIADSVLYYTQRNITNST